MSTLAGKNGLSAPEGRTGGRAEERMQEEAERVSEKELVIWEMFLFNIGQIKVESIWCREGSWWLDMPLLMPFLFSFLFNTLK